MHTINAWRVGAITHVSLVPAAEAPTSWEAPAFDLADVEEIIECARTSSRKGRGADVQRAVTFIRDHAIRAELLAMLERHAR